MLTKKEKEFLKQLVQERLKHFEREAKDEIFQDSPGFLGAEEKYDEWLKKLMKKLE